MKPTFITSGTVKTIVNIDKSEYYLVGRLNIGNKVSATPIRLSKVVPEYYTEGRHVKIDAYGNPWIKSL